MPNHRPTTLPPEGRPKHALYDGYPLVVNMRLTPFLCIECLDPCDSNAFQYGEPDCRARHAGHGSYDDDQARRRSRGNKA